MPTNHNLIPRRNAQLLAIPPLPEVPFLLHRMHRHDHHHHKPVLIMGVDADPDEICHMVEKLLTVLFVG
jgi:hypothetical protein